MTTLAELQKQWHAEDTGTSQPSAETNPIASLFPQLSSLFNSTKVKVSSANAYGSSGSGSLPFLPFANQQASSLSKNNDNVYLIAEILIVVVVVAVILKAVR